MSNLTTILLYQETDKKLFALEKYLSTCEERKEWVNAKRFLEKAAEKLDSVEMKAAALREKATEMSARCSAIEKDLAELSGIDELIENGADVSYYKKAAQKQMDVLRKTKAELSAVIGDVEETDKEYKELKKKVIAMQKKYEEAKEKYKQVKASKEGEKTALEEELSKIAANISEAAMARYATKRKEKVFPVVSPLTKDGRCSCCSMDIPLAARSAIDDSGTIECESCHRILYAE